MSQGQHPTTPTVLLIEADPSLRRLISLGLRHRGLQVIEASSPHTLPLSTTDPVDLLVLDVDGSVTGNWSLFEHLQNHPQLSTLPSVVLSWEAQSANPASPIACLAKPFDARALHTTIDQLLAARAQQQADQQARAEEILLASYPVHVAPSIWPVVTAAGLLLVVIGMLLQFTFAAIFGLLIVLVALLFWTLGSTKPASPRIAISNT